jgi:hypothetical protein
VNVALSRARCQGAAIPSLPFPWHFSGKLVAARSIARKSRTALEKGVYRWRDFELEPEERRPAKAGKSIVPTPDFLLDEPF